VQNGLLITISYKISCVARNMEVYQKVIESFPLATKCTAFRLKFPSSDNCFFPPPNDVATESKQTQEQ